MWIEKNHMQTEKNPHISRPVQFKPMQLKSQLYFSTATLTVKDFESHKPRKTYFFN